MRGLHEKTETLVSQLPFFVLLYVSPEVTVTSLHPLRLCRLAVFTLKIRPSLSRPCTCSPAVTRYFNQYKPTFKTETSLIQDGSDRKMACSELVAEISDLAGSLCIYVCIHV